LGTADGADIGGHQRYQRSKMSNPSRVAILADFEHPDSAGP
jgi:hypothetical protein